MLCHPYPSRSWLGTGLATRPGGCIRLNRRRWDDEGEVFPQPQKEMVVVTVRGQPEFSDSV